MISLENLTFSYSKGTIAINDVTATIGNGLHLLLGENGAGKTTLLHLMSGLLTPQSGRCLIDGKDVSLRSPQIMERLFFLPEEGFIECPAKTINSFATHHAIFYPSFNPDVLKDCLNEFGLTGDEKFRTLSLGNRKKSALAYVISLGTEVLLLDEPTNGLDISSKQSLQRLLARYTDDSKTVIISTHTVWDLKNLYDGVIVMQRSRLLFAKPVNEITAKISFINSPMPHPEAIYRESSIAGINTIVPCDGENFTDIDFILLYSALQSKFATRLTDILLK